MAQEFRTIALIGKYRSPEIAESLRRLAAFLEERGVRVLVEQITATSAQVTDWDVAPYETIGAEADAAIIIGGDGTLLNAARHLAEFEIPLVGINQGRLGFMTDIAHQDMLAAVGQLLEGRFAREERFLLEAEVRRGGERAFRTLAFNDVVVNKGDVGRMIEIEVKIDGEFLFVLRADGMIVATPTGSTAYALSANGPILHPKVGGIAVVPLCPHALSNRPITISDMSRIDLTLVPPHEARVHFDGQERVDVRGGDDVRIFRSDHSVILLHPPGYSYFAMLREKLHWSATPKH